MVSAPRRRRRITERDVSIARWLTVCGLGTAEQAAREFFEGSIKPAYRRLKALEELGLMKGERIYYRGPGIYRVTERGTRLAGMDLPPPRLDLERLDHTLELVELSWELRNDPDASVEAWIWEREIRHEKMAARREEGSGRMRPGGPMGRTPDGIAILENGSEVAVELELSPKRKASYIRIFEHYEKQFAAGEVVGVWFYCASSKTMARIERIALQRDVRGFVDFMGYDPVFERLR